MTTRKQRSIERPVLTKRYDLAGNSLLRQAVHWFRCKTSIMGNYGQGAGLKNLLILWVLHYLGGPLFRLRVWLNNQYKLKARIRSLLGRSRG